MIRPLYTLVALALTVCAVHAGLPKVATLKPGESLFVSMRLQGFTITGAEFLFTSDKVVVMPLNKKAGELVLTAEEKVKVDGYLDLVLRAPRRIPAQEGFDYSIKHFKDQQQLAAWSLQIDDVMDAEKKTLSLYELKTRVEKQLEEKAGAAGAAPPFAVPATKLESKPQPVTPQSEPRPR